VKKIVAWLKIIRIPIIFISILGALVGALNTANYLDEKLSFFQITLVILGASFLSSGLMVHNDVTDLKSDEVNRPHKPLPSKIIKPKTAYIVGTILMILAVFSALIINIRYSGEVNYVCGFITAIIVVIGIAYNHHGKKLGIYGNIAVAIGVGAIPFWGSVAVFPSELFIMFPLAFIIFIMEVGREIMVNAGDYQGDLKAGFKTLPVKIGRKHSMYVALIFYIAFIPLFPLPAFDYLGLGIPKVFGSIYLIGGTVFALSLLLTWFLTYVVVLQNDEGKIWTAFERYERIGTRLMVIVFQIFLFLEAFY
jgi:geranylgeranylglycerol-phosphate geranylgeranyltransferase